MSELTHQEEAQEKPTNHDKIIHLNPPEVKTVEKSLAEQLDKSALEKYIQECFGNDYFKLIQEDIEKRFKGKKIGLRAILCSTGENKINIEGRGPVNTIENIISTGSDLTENTTRITIPGEITPEGDIHTDMSAYYLSLSVKNAIKSGNKEVVPAILIYDLSSDGVSRDSDYDIHFSTNDDKKESLLAIYVLDTSSLQPKTDFKEILS